MTQFYGITRMELPSVPLDHGVRELRAPTDVSDAEWAVVRRLLPVPGWLRGRGGQPEAY